MDFVVEHVTNAEVLNGELELLKKVKKRKRVYLGHIMQGLQYKIFHFIVHIVGK